ncbi:MAG: DUF4198 domain-containing protein [Gammaproteobacteria bacterium]|nr:DUF4198 domain-containing protein [Gammaproteobacteria bacterium]
MTKLRRLALGFALLSGCLGGAAQAGPLWFSDRPPSADWSKHAHHSHGGMVERGRQGVSVKRLWLRDGRVPASAVYPQFGDDAEIAVLGIDGKNLAPELFKVNSGGGITFPMAEEGFYNAYLIERRVEDDVLKTSIVKAEVLKHSCSEGHDPAFTASRMPPRDHAGIALDIIRERRPGEDFHTRMRSGDELVFRVNYNGSPAAGAHVSLTTQQGWSKQVMADADGRAVFGMIRDYYPAWHEFDKRHSEAFLVTAEFRADEPGELHGTPFRQAHYTATLPGTFYPSELEYSSYLVGLLVALVAAALAAGSVFFYRLKHGRPARERLQ